MCRLYGFRATDLTKVECTLVLAQNSLLAQSRADMAGGAHSDGWGIASYENGFPTIERRETAAFRDLRFSVTSERVFACTVLAHVRSATVGVADLANTHPYSYGPWTFAHNGTVMGFEHLEERLASETAEKLLARRRGTNDSEAAFLWMMTRLAQAGIDLERRAPSTDLLVDAFGRAVSQLAALCAEAAPERPARLNFLLTDGQSMVATRWNRTLYWLERRGVHDCELCGTPHIRHQGEDEYRAVVIASEPITSESWREIPEQCLIAVDAELDTRLMPLVES